MSRKVIVFVFLFCLWFIGSIIAPFNVGFYSSITIPKIVPSVNVISLIWFIIYLLNTTSMYFLIKDYDLNDDFYFILILNYLFCQFFPLFFFFFNNLVLAMICNIVISVSSIFLITETKKINTHLAYLFIPHFLWSFFLLIISISIYLIN